MHDDTTTTSVQGQNFCISQFSMQQIKRVRQGQQSSYQNKLGLGYGDTIYCKISDIALVAAYKVIEMIANMSLLSCSKNKFIHSGMCEQLNI